MSQFTQFTGNGQPQQWQFFGASRTWTVPVNGNYVITACGGGATGASGGNYGGWASLAGGGAGGVAIKYAYLTAGTSLVITIAAQSTRVTTLSNGNNGNTTTVSGGGISLTCNGGSAGFVNYSSGATQAGGAGGTATGGDVNYTGGAGGSAQSNTANVAAGGGGSPGLWQTGSRGGNATANNWRMAGGGGGVGGRGGDCLWTNRDDVNCGAGGGSAIVACGDTGAATNAGATAIGNSLTDTIISGFTSPGGAGGVGSGNGTGASVTTLGGGGGGGAGGASCILGGGGGAHTNQSQAVVFGGGSGGGYIRAEEGGQGFVLITWVKS